jgi:hypothetical protein
MNIRLIESPLGVRWTSLAMLAVVLVVVSVVRRRPLLGLVAAMGWLVAFEIPYEATDILVRHRSGVHLTSWASWLLTVAGWPFAAHLAGIRPHWRWVAASAAIFAVWIATGFQHNDPGQTGPVTWLPEALNVGSKSALGVAYLLGALRPERSGWGNALVLRHRLLGMAAERLQRLGQGAR